MSAHGLRTGVHITYITSELRFGVRSVGSTKSRGEVDRCSCIVIVITQRADVQVRQVIVQDHFTFTGRTAAAASILRGPKGVVEHATHERGRAFGAENAFQTRGEVHGQIQQYRVDRTASGPAQCVITALVRPASFDRRPFFRISLGRLVHAPAAVDNDESAYNSVIIMIILRRYY